MSVVATSASRWVSQSNARLGALEGELLAVGAVQFVGQISCPEATRWAQRFEIRCVCLWLLISTTCEEFSNQFGIIFSLFVIRVTLGLWIQYERLVQVCTAGQSIINGDDERSIRFGAVRWLSFIVFLRISLTSIGKSYVAEGIWSGTCIGNCFFQTELSSLVVRLMR